MKPSNDEGRLDALLEFLRDSRNLDFTGYKRPSLTRRIRKRMETVGAETFDEYSDLLEVDPREADRLVDTILINVTRFFRDDAAWKYLDDVVVPSILARSNAGEEIRIWSAGCATGEEPYGLAMLLAEHLGVDEFTDRVKIFATDTDQLALASARAATYSADQLDVVADDRRERFFASSDEGFVMKPEIRQRVIFGPHDITRDPPISRLDLLTCRNVLMYLRSETQRQALTRFHQALGEGGVLFLGKAETIFAHSDLFEALDPKLRIFSRAPRPTLARARAGEGHAADATTSAAQSSMLHELANEASPVAQLVIDAEGTLVAANTKARRLFTMTNDAVGRPVAEQDLSSRPIELSTLIREATTQNSSVSKHNITFTPTNGDERVLDALVTPLREANVTVGCMATFTDVTELGRTRAELERSQRDLQSANVGLESTNEEVQSTNEELETTNEELQSANEELETMNEELQSANEQLETMNTDLLLQAHQIAEGKEFLESILDSLAVGVAVLSNDFDIMLWNSAVEDTFGLRSEKAIGRSLLALDIGLPVGDLRPALQELVDDPLSAPRHIVLDGVDRRGAPLKCRVSVGWLSSGNGAANIVVLIDPQAKATT